MNARRYMAAALYRGFKPMRLSAIAAALGVTAQLSFACEPATMAACVGQDHHAGVIKALALEGLQDQITDIALPLKSRSPVVFGLVKVRGGKRLIVVNYTATTGNNVVHTDAGSPTVPCDVIINVSALVYGNRGLAGGVNTDGSTALTLGAGWAAGSTFRLNITSAGAICGGGAAGKGGDAFNGGGVIEVDISGGTGGDALNTNGRAITIDNAGYIWSGGGSGGSGGAAADNVFGSHANGAGGGGGGGGAGGDGGDGGNGGTGYGGGGANGSNGTVGSSYPFTGGGNGGGGALIFFASSGGGGNGGDYGQAGSAGSAGSSSVSGGYESGGSPPGVAGYAVRHSGAGVTWLAGNNGTQVKGAVA